MKESTKLVEEATLSNRCLLLLLKVYRFCGRRTHMERNFFIGYYPLIYYISLLLLQFNEMITERPFLSQLSWLYFLLHYTLLLLQWTLIGKVSKEAQKMVKKMRLGIGFGRRIMDV